jgi:hypothetical protein
MTTVFGTAIAVCATSLHENHFLVRTHGRAQQHLRQLFVRIHENHSLLRTHGRAQQHLCQLFVRASRCNRSSWRVRYVADAQIRMNRVV